MVCLLVSSKLYHLHNLMLHLACFLSVSVFRSRAPWCATETRRSPCRVCSLVLPRCSPSHVRPVVSRWLGFCLLATFSGHEHRLFLGLLLFFRSTSCWSRMTELSRRKKRGRCRCTCPTGYNGVPMTRRFRVRPLLSAFPSFALFFWLHSPCPWVTGRQRKHLLAQTDALPGGAATGAPY